MKTLIYSFLILSFGLVLHAQDGFYVTILDDGALPENITVKSDASLDLKFNTSEIETIFDKYKILGFEKFSELTKNPLLINVYRIKTKDFALANELVTKFPAKYENIQYWEEPIPLYDPDDYALETSGQTSLDLIRAKDA